MLEHDSGKKEEVGSDQRTKRQNSITVDNKEREELFGREHQQHPENDTKSDPKQKKVFAEAHSKLLERGEKLQTLETKVTDLAQRSQNFLEMAKKLRQKEENKKWYEL